MTIEAQKLNLVSKILSIDKQSVIDLIGEAIQQIERANTATTDELLSEEVFWQIVDCIDWTKKTSEDKLKPAITYHFKDPR